MSLRVLAILFLSLATGPVAAQAVAVGSANGTSQVTGQVGAERISVAFNSTPLSEALWTIARRSGVTLIFEGSMIPAKQISYSAENVTPDAAFEAVLKGTGLKVNRGKNGKLVLVDETRNAAKAQGVITGKVTDAKTGRGISGATVSVDNIRAATTNDDGLYRSTGVATGTHSITVRLVGYAKQARSVTVGDGATVTADFKMEASANVLDQVIVTGTVVSTELKAVPTAMSVITAKQIEERGITRIDQLFRGEIPGLFAMEQGSGAGLDEVVMYSRGATKLSTVTDAAFITNPIKTYVDGIEMADSRYLSQIDPKSIERIEILAGPQASTIYGSNAINGVMQIFTKRGNTARPSVTLSLVEGFAQNNFTSALASSHQYDGSISGVEGMVSYNVGAGWDYTGAWTPGKQMQRTSVYGGTRYQSGIVSLDLSARQGWTQNKRRGSTDQVATVLSQEGRWTVNFGSFTGLVPPGKRALRGRTTGATVGFTPFAWWSHQLSAGSDVSDTDDLGSGAGFTSPSDTTYFNSQTPYSRTSQSYSSTIRVPIGLLARATLTYGADHWRTRTSTIGWSVNPATGSFTFSSVNRTRPDKNSGAYVQGQLGLWEELFFTYGIRADWNPNFGDKAKMLPGRYGMSYAKDLGIVTAKLRGSYGRSIRPPGPNLIQGGSILPTSFGGSDILAFYVTPGSTLYQTLPNSELGPEFQQGGEGGAELYFGSRGSLVITRYNQTVDGLINSIVTDSVRALNPGLGTISVTGCSLTNTAAINTPRSDGYCYYRQSQNINVGSIRNQGWEIESGINTGPLTTRGTYSWLKSRVTGITPKYRSQLTNAVFSPGQTFNFVPEHAWALNVSYARNGTSAALNVNGLGQTVHKGDVGDIGLVTSGNLRLRVLESQRLSSLSDIRFPQSGYTTVNLNASQRFSEQVEATLMVANLTNYYQNDLNFILPTIGRQARFGVRLRF